VFEKEIDDFPGFYEERQKFYREFAYDRRLFSSSFFRVRIRDVCPGNPTMSSSSRSRTHRQPAQTLRELSVEKTEATGTSREQAADVAQERMDVICDLKRGDDREIIEFRPTLFVWWWSEKCTVLEDGCGALRGDLRQVEWEVHKDRSYSKDC
jgi:hypothetical protein